MQARDHSGGGKKRKGHGEDFIARLDIEFHEGEQ